MSLLLLAGCAAQHAPAPILERPIPSRGSQNTIKPVPSASSVAVSRSDDGRPGTYTVKKGDTLYRIAFEHGFSYRDLAAWNNLANPDDIKVDQVLRLTSPGESADGVEVRPLQDTARSAPAVTSAKPMETLAYPKAIKQPYSQKNAESIGKLAEGGSARTAVASRAAATHASSPSTVKIVPAEKKSAASETTPAMQNGNSGHDWISPTPGKLLKSFSDETKGVDIGGKMGQSIVASGAGKVVYAGSGLRGYGKMVILKHNNEYLSAYAHNSKLLVKEGDVVKRGEKIAEMGNTDTDRVKLHFEIRRFGKPVDPTKFITVDRP
ncbi:peptidoglycan DD-metalloendopeptidase family protein [Formivibrio citricus]|uniref:peptidoglycan DD-metalloendopeptidase family protein n=1 Tax=Formivibrio citricus TaxID=83765 RepID=UPI001FDFBE42|nr:peptidoglycan DD-metalloendopeptidase family protein [Formivibrio citricus]